MDVQRLLASLIENVIWVKILAVFFIVYGVLQCLSIVGLLVGWLPIWLGVLLLSSAKLLDLVGEGGNSEHAVESIEKISLYFKISGIVVLVFVGVLVVVGTFALFILFS